MRISLLALVLLALCSPLTGCKRSLDTRDVNEFVDLADNKAREGNAPEICGLRGENFTMTVNFQGHEERYGPSKIDMNRKVYCKEAGRVARLRQYKLDRKSLDISLAPDRKTAVVKTEYVETMPYFEPDVPAATPDDFRDWQVVESQDESVIGIEGGDLVFLSTKSNAVQTLYPKNEISLPYR